MSTLKQGARGANVKSLQQQLIDAGYLDKQYATGYFGPLTQNALNKFNAEKKMPATNTEVASVDYLASHPALEGTPEGEYLARIKQTNPELYVSLANTAMRGGAFSPALFATANKQAEELLTPYYDQDRQNSGGILSNYLDSALGNYETDRGQLVNDATTEFRDLNNSEGERGTWSSSGRNLRMNSLENNYNNKFQKLYNMTRGDVNSRLQSQEYNYGAGNTPNVDLTKTNATFGNTPEFASTSSGVYNPFNFVGRKNAEKSAGVAGLTSELAGGTYQKFPNMSNIYNQ